MRLVYSSKSFSPLAYAMRLRACSLVFQSFSFFSTSSVFVFLSLDPGLKSVSCFVSVCCFFTSSTASFLMSSPYTSVIAFSRSSSAASLALVFSSAHLCLTLGPFAETTATPPYAEGRYLSFSDFFTSSSTIFCCFFCSIFSSARSFPISFSLSLAPSISYFRISDFI